MRTAAFILCVFLSFSLAACNGGSSNSVGPGTNPDEGSYVVLAWNDLGMHCLNPTYDQAVVLPPFNTLWAQVIRRGNPPAVVTADIAVEFSIKGNTYSYGKRMFGQFWDHAGDLFPGFVGPGGLPHDVGLTGTALSGAMHASGDHFVAEGIPVVPVLDSQAWTPYQVAVVVVRNASGSEIARTEAVVPVSDEINCGKCHGSDAWADIISEHDDKHQTNLAGSVPVLCAGCHGSPALGQMTPGSSGIFLSKAIHGSHATRGAACYDCHPGVSTQCNRSARHAASGGNCETCHGNMEQIASRISATVLPWLDEPQCDQCHAGVAGVSTSGQLYRNSTGHGGVYCAACHNSPHAMYPSLIAQDNYQPKQYHGSTARVKTIGSCGACHSSSRGAEGEIGEFGEEHGGTSPERKNACHTCHTVVPTDTNRWPHAWQWTNSNT